MDEAKRKREAWGTKPCKHPNFDKEYSLGSGTGDYDCVTCGTSFTYEEMDAIRQKRSKRR
jgi:hypothetical protein